MTETVVNPTTAAITGEALVKVAKIIGMAIGGIFPALSIGKIGTATMKAIGRNPEAANKLFVPMILGMALAEAIAIYTLVVVFTN